LPHGQLSTELRTAVNRLSRILRNQKSDSTITDAHFSALARLDREGPRTLAELSRAEGITPPSMTKTVNVLVERGLIAKTGHGVDRRKVLLALTDAGHKVVMDTRRQRDSWLTPRLAKLTVEERRTLTAATDIMRRLTQH
jgi:DNA-binding MarR family transcriptional regulator